MNFTMYIDRGFLEGIEVEITANYFRGSHETREEPGTPAEMEIASAVVVKDVWNYAGTAIQYKEGETIELTEAEIERAENEAWEIWRGEEEKRADALAEMHYEDREGYGR